jgi:hypothetical protein
MWQPPLREERRKKSLKTKPKCKPRAGSDPGMLEKKKRLPSKVFEPNRKPREREREAEGLRRN